MSVAICPHCGGSIKINSRAAKEIARRTGAIGGSTTGASKRRDVDYAALARASHAARKANS